MYVKNVQYKSTYIATPAKYCKYTFLMKTSSKQCKNDMLAWYLSVLRQVVVDIVVVI